MAIDFYFDCSSPWTYLGFHRMEALARELGAEVTWKPILVGGVFNAVNPSVQASRDEPVAAKVAYQAKDLADWAAHTGLAITWHPTVFPVNSVKAMRGCLVLAGEGKLTAFARAVFEAYWGEDRDISQNEVMEGIAAKVGVDGAALLEACGRDEIKAALRANTDELIARGGFGSPTIFVGDDMYFGNDRIPLVREAIQGGGTT